MTDDSAKTDAELDELLRQLRDPHFVSPTLRHENIDAIATLRQRLAAAEQREAGLVEALTPCGDTKAAYHGEFKFSVPDERENEDGEMEEYEREVLVPWTTVKEIMAAIRTYAALPLDGLAGSAPASPSLGLRDDHLAKWMDDPETRAKLTAPNPDRARKLREAVIEECAQVVEAHMRSIGLVKPTEFERGKASSAASILAAIRNLAKVPT